MTSYDLIFGVVNLIIYLPICYFSYRIGKNLSEEADVASAMFFLKEDTTKTFKYTSLLVSVVAAGELFLLFNHFHEGLKPFGYFLLTVAALGVLYFARTLSNVTQPPSKNE